MRFGAVAMNVDALAKARVANDAAEKRLRRMIVDVIRELSAIIRDNIAAQLAEGRVAARRYAFEATMKFDEFFALIEATRRHRRAQSRGWRFFEVRRR